MRLPSEGSRGRGLRRVLSIKGPGEGGAAEGAGLCWGGAYAAFLWGGAGGVASPCAAPGGGASGRERLFVQRPGLFVGVANSGPAPSTRPAPPPKKELVIPLIPPHRWRNPEPPRADTGPAPAAGHAPASDSTPNTDPTPSGTPADPPSVEAQAVQELLQGEFGGSWGVLGTRLSPPGPPLTPPPPQRHGRARSSPTGPRDPPSPSPSSCLTRTSPRGRSR